MGYLDNLKSDDVFNGDTSNILVGQAPLFGRRAVSIGARVST